MPKKRADKREYRDDDGRVIASMNVDGMPWYSEKHADGPGASSEYQGNVSPDAINTAPKMTRRENLAFMSGVLRAALLAALVFIGGLFLFILFCVNIWFR